MLDLCKRLLHDISRWAAWATVAFAAVGAATARADQGGKEQPAPTAADPLAAGDIAGAWPCFRGRGGSGISPYANVPDDWDVPSGKNIVWKSSVPLEGNSSPIVVGKRLFLTGADAAKRQVFAYDVDNGKLLWQRDAPSTPGSRNPVSDKGDVLSGYASCTPATDGRYVAAIFANGDLAAYDLDGKPAWSHSFGIPQSPYGHAASLTVYRHLLIVPFDQGDAKTGLSKLRALDFATGRTVWEQSRAVRSSWTTPIVVRVADRDELLTVANPLVVAYDPASGKEIWRVQFDKKIWKGDVAPSPVAQGNVLIAAANDYSPVFAIRPNGAGDVGLKNVLWKVEENTPDICSPLATEQFLFLLTSDGTLTCYDLKKGDKLWEESLGEFPCRSSPAMVGKELYIFGESGKCWIVEPSAAGVKRVRQTDLGEGCVTSPAFQDGRMYVRGKKSLFCIGKK